MALFKNNAVSRLFQIVGEPKDDVDLRNVEGLKEYVAKEYSHYDGEKQKVIELVKVEDVGPIINDSTDKNGNPCPYTYGQPRYTNLDRIRKARKTSEL
jgi:hypothetical protein